MKLARLHLWEGEILVTRDDRAYLKDQHNFFLTVLKYFQDIAQDGPTGGDQNTAIKTLQKIDKLGIFDNTERAYPLYQPEGQIEMELVRVVFRVVGEGG